MYEIATRYVARNPPPHCVQYKWHARRPAPLPTLNAEYVERALYLAGVTTSINTNSCCCVRRGRGSLAVNKRTAERFVVVFPWGRGWGIALLHCRNLIMSTYLVQSKQNCCTPLYSEACRRRVHQTREPYSYEPTEYQVTTPVLITYQVT